MNIPHHNLRDLMNFLDNLRRRDLNDLLMCLACMVLVIFEMNILCRRVDLILPASSMYRLANLAGLRHGWKLHVCVTSASPKLVLERGLSQNGYG